jgi:hypothetical protein
MIPLAQGAALVELSDERIRQLARMGYCPKPVKGMIPLVGLVKGVLRFYRDEERTRSKSAADGRVRDARAREIELRIAKEEGELVPVADAIGVMDEYATAVITAIKNLPTRYSRNMADRARLQPLVDEVLTFVADKMKGAAQEVRDLRG